MVEMSVGMSPVVEKNGFVVAHSCKSRIGIRLDDGNDTAKAPLRPYPYDKEAACRLLLTVVYRETSHIRLCPFTYTSTRAWFASS